MSFRIFFLLLLVSSLIFAKNVNPNFSGRWQLDEARSTYKLTTTVIKDLPDRLKAKIPSYGAPRLLGVPRFFSKPPVMVVRHVNGRLSTSFSTGFYGWFPKYTVFLIDGKEREDKKDEPIVSRSKTQWEANRIVREWSDKDVGLYEISEGRDVLSLSDDGKTLTFDSHCTHKLRMTVDDRPYELDDVEDIQSVFVKKQ